MGKSIGRCRLCGQEKELTFEHVPPKVIFNSAPLRRYDGEDVLDNPDAFKNRKLRSTKFNRGSGGYYLCKDCNSFLGSEYNETYAYIAKYIAYEISNSSTSATTGIDFSSRNLKWGRFFRQAMAMFVDISDVCTNDDRLRSYILNPKSTDFDHEKYKLLFYAVDDGGSQNKKLVGRIEIESLRLKAAEITTFPIGFLLLIDEERQVQIKTASIDFSRIGADITQFSSWDCNCEYKIEATLPLKRMNDAEGIFSVLPNFERAKRLEENL